MSSMRMEIAAIATESTTSLLCLFHDGNALPVGKEHASANASVCLQKSEEKLQ